ncbi:hypothetical protein EON64_16895 [archaeon]|nr:MAG: hypothetical protein EON64_16895 [archaeon]
MIVTKASTSHEREAEKQKQILEYKQLLDLNPTASLSKHAISRAYKKLSLREHPDKGGDPHKFNALREAYNTLLAMQQELDERESTVAVQYEASVEKKPGVGLGITISEDGVRQQLLVNSVNPHTKVLYVFM